MKWSLFLTLTLLSGTTWSPFVASSKPAAPKPSHSQPNQLKPTSGSYEPDFCDPDDLTAGDQPPIPCAPLENHLCAEPGVLAFYPEDIQRCTEVL